MNDGFKFECQRTGNCCSNPSIIVTLTNRDVFALFRKLGSNFDLLLKRVDFISAERSKLREKLVFPTFLTTRGNVVIAIHKFENGDCVFYNPNSKECTIYESRPVVCRCYPFVFSGKKGKIFTTISPIAKKYCSGLGKGKRLERTALNLLAERILGEIDEMSFIAGNINREAREGKPLTLRETLLILINYTGQKA